MKVEKTNRKTAQKSEEEVIVHVLSDANRLRILRLLSENKELCARDILTHFPITQPTLSHHMSVLLESKLIQARKSGRWVFYHLSEVGLDKVISFFLALKESVSVAKYNELPAAKDEKSSVGTIMQSIQVESQKVSKKKGKDKPEKKRKNKKKKK